MAHAADERVRTAAATTDAGDDETMAAKHRYTLQVASSAELFLKSFHHKCDTSCKSRISGAFHPDTIRRAMEGVDASSVLGRSNVHLAFRRSYGFQTWLLAPEVGVRALLREALGLYSAPLKNVVEEVHSATVTAAEAAMAGSGVSSGAGAAADEVLVSLLLLQAKSVMEGWLDATWAQLCRNLHAEAEFPAPEHFAGLKARLAALLSRMNACRAAQQVAALRQALAHLEGLPTAELASQASFTGVTASGASVALPNCNTTPPAAPQPSWSEFYMGWLEKRNRHGRWQRRWVALSVRQQRLWYFGHPEEQPARGMVLLAGAIVLEHPPTEGPLVVHITSRPATSAASPEPDSEHASFTGAHTKTDITSLALRAGSAQSKRQWVDMLARAVEGPALAGEPGLQGDKSLLLNGEEEEEEEEEEDQGPSSPPGLPLQHKISTQVFADAGPMAATPIAPAPRSPGAVTVAPAEGLLGAAPAPATGHIEARRERGPAGDDAQSQEDEEARLAAETALFEEVAQQAGALPTEEERAVLECVAAAVSEYVGEARGRLAEQAAKVIADGMLPLARGDELRDALLRVMVPAV